MKNLPAPVQRWLTLLLPPFALLVCCFVMVPRHKKMRQIEREIRTAQAGIQDYRMKLAAIKDLPQDPRIATLPLTRQEQSDFLRGLAALCIRTGNRMLSANALAAVPPQPENGQAQPPATNNPGAAPAQKPLPPDVYEVKSTLVFEGSFASLRAFLADLQQSRRLVSLIECHIGPGQGGYPNLQTTINLSRYVDAPSGAPSGSATPAPPQQKG